MAAKDLLRAFGEEVRARRAARDLSQEKLAEKAGLHRNFIGLVERGQRNPTLLTMAAIAAALKTAASELLAAAERR